MTKSTGAPLVHRPEMIERTQSARRRIQACLTKELRALGADTDAAGFAQQVLGRSGLEFLDQYMQPEIPPPPPIAVLFGMEWLEIDRSRVVLALDTAEWMFNPLGAVHGGIAATLLDTVLGSAVHSTLPAGTGYATTDLHIRFVRPMTADTGRAIATGTVVHEGRRNLTAEGRVEAEATGKLIATGTAGCTILRPS